MEDGDTFGLAHTNENELPKKDFEIDFLRDDALSQIEQALANPIAQVQLRHTTCSSVKINGITIQVTRSYHLNSSPLDVCVAIIPDSGERIELDYQKEINAILEYFKLTQPYGYFGEYKGCEIVKIDEEGLGNQLFKIIQKGKKEVKLTINVGENADPEVTRAKVHELIDLIISS